MPEKVFGLGVNQVMAYAAVANVLLVVVLTAINVYYAWYSKRQAEATRAQVDASNRQAQVAEESLSILRKQIDLQRTEDLGTVSLQLKVGVHRIEDWLKRLASDTYPQLPEEITILPGEFGVATQRANAIDHLVAQNMGAASLYAGEAETNLNILRAQNAAQTQAWKEMQEKATKNLNIARYKLNVARARWEAEVAVPGKEQNG